MLRHSIFLLLLSMFAVVASYARKDTRTVVRLETNKGAIRIALFDETPRHRDNFVKLAKEGFYDETLFHRVIRDFMIQGGDPDSRNAPRDKELGDGGPGYELPAEIRFPELYNVRGMVAAAREPDDVNPEFRSSGSQFYIVWGRRMGNSDARNYTQQWAESDIENLHFIVEDYKTKGGAWHLDGEYTVFGEVVEGLDIVKEIQSVATDAKDRPLDDVVIQKAIVEKH